MQEPTAKSAYPEAVTVWRADCDFTKCKGGPSYRISLSFHAPSSLFMAGQEHPRLLVTPERWQHLYPAPLGTAMRCQQGREAPRALPQVLGTEPAWLGEEGQGDRRTPMTLSAPGGCFWMSFPFLEAAASDSSDVVVVPRHLESSLEGQWWVNTNLNKSQGST